MSASLFQRGDFTLASGQRSCFKIECDALTDEDWSTLALMLAERLPEFHEVVGVPRGGLPLADALREHRTLDKDGPLLVVDDVWTTGGSMRRFTENYHPDLEWIAAVAFARNPVPGWVTALWSVAASSGSGETK